MSSHPSFPPASAPPEGPAAPAAPDAPDPAILRAERRLRLLEELADIGMALARTLRPGATADEETGAAGEGEGAGGDPARAFGSLSRAIRLTLALEARTDQDLRDLKAGIVRAREEAPARAAERRRAAATAAVEESAQRKEQLRWLVVEAAEAEIGDADAFDERLAALEERLEHDPAYDDCAARPLRETVERLCADLTLRPDWSRWNGEGWTKAGAPARPRFSPFCEPSPRPLLEEEPSSEPPPPAPGWRHDLQ